MKRWDDPDDNAKCTPNRHEPQPASANSRHISNRDAAGFCESAAIHSKHTFKGKLKSNRVISV